jgi:nucleoid-associated protein YgaU
MYAAGRGINQMRATRAGGYLSRFRRGLVVMGVVGAASVGFAVVAHGGTQQPETVVVVQPGDTLWSIASEHYPSDDVRVRVEDIERANGLQSPVIEAGQTLRLPAG